MRPRYMTGRAIAENFGHILATALADKTLTVSARYSLGGPVAIWTGTGNEPQLSAAFV